MYEDPLWKYRHTLIGVGLALVASMFIAALLGAWLAPLWSGSRRAATTIYFLLVLYVLIGTVALLKTTLKAQQAPFSFQRLLLWIVSLWMWPLLVFRK